MVDNADVRKRLAAAVPPNVLAVCKTLAEAGHQAVTVGGAVRDAILGRTPGDWDVATSARPEDVMALFRRTIPTGLQHGTVTIVTGRGEESHVEVTTYRGEGAYTDARRPDHVTFGVPLVEDLARRDLRVNAMAYDPASDQLIDPYAGQVDIDEKKLRAVGPTGNVYEDAVARFTEDGLRVMRAVRFAAVLEFELDPDTERGIVPALPSLAKVSKERISDELRKLLATRQPSRGLAIAERTGIIALILPRLAAALDAWGEARGGRGAAVAAWLSRVDAATPAVRLGALLVELGEPASDPHYRDAAAFEHVDGVLRALKFSNQESVAAAHLVSIARAVELADLTPPQLRKLFSLIGREHAQHAIELWKAHTPAHPGVIAEGERILREKQPLSPKDLALTGKDLIDALAQPPGPVIGRILGVLLDRVIDDPRLNTRDQLLEIAQQLELQVGR
ncbi:MAG: tRNA adenylyltransferase [Myxococcales bacterium]|nr:tRNA adenylyltransferase [Myxococcales bacterium]